MDINVDGARPFKLAIKIDEGTPQFVDFAAQHAKIKINGEAVYTNNPAKIKIRDGAIVK